MNYVGLDPRFNLKQLGYIPDFMSEDDPRPASEQLDENYIGGWRPLAGWKLDPATMTLAYPDDPPLEPFAFTELHGDRILFYPHAQVMILQPDGAFEVSRMD